jgi:hypothetical protein
MRNSIRTKIILVYSIILLHRHASFHLMLSFGRAAAAAVFGGGGKRKAEDTHQDGGDEARQRRRLSPAAVDTESKNEIQNDDAPPPPFSKATTPTNVAPPAAYVHHLWRRLVSSSGPWGWSAQPPDIINRRSPRVGGASSTSSEEWKWELEDAGDDLKLLIRRAIVTHCSPKQAAVGALACRGWREALGPHVAVQAGFSGDDATLSAALDSLQGAGQEALAPFAGEYERISANPPPRVRDEKNAFGIIGIVPSALHACTWARARFGILAFLALVPSSVPARTFLAHSES